MSHSQHRRTVVADKDIQYKYWAKELIKTTKKMGITKSEEQLLNKYINQIFSATIKSCIYYNRVMSQSSMMIL